ELRRWFTGGVGVLRVFPTTCVHMWTASSVSFHSAYGSDGHGPPPPSAEVASALRVELTSGELSPRRRVTGVCRGLIAPPRTCPRAAAQLPPSRAARPSSGGRSDSRVEPDPDRGRRSPGSRPT